MGCASSRHDASEVIQQCKERRRAIHDAVNCRQDFAIAHVAYIQTLRNVGLALRRFSEGDVLDTSPQSPSTPILQLPGASSPVPLLSPPRPLLNSPPPSPPPSPPVSHSPAAVTTPVPVLAKSASPASPPLPASMSPPASSRASHFSESSPPPLTEASSPHDDMIDAPQPYSVNGMGSPDRASDFSATFYSPRRDETDDYFASYSPPQHMLDSSPPMPSPSRNTSSWFMYDIFDAPPIPYNLVEQRRRKRGGYLEDYEEDDPVNDLEHVRKQEEIPDLEEEEPKEEVHSVKSLDKGKEVDEKETVVIEDKKVDVVEKPKDVPETITETPVEKVDGEVEQIALPPSAEKEVVVVAEPKASPIKELAVVTSEQGRDLTGAVRHIHTHFARACRSGKNVSGMLEMQMVDHLLGFLDAKDSSKVFNAITFHWSRKSSLAMRDAYVDNDVAGCSMMFGSHASTLERLYAWEKKLYDEVKAGESIRFLFDRKCQKLHSLDAKGGDPMIIDKTRAALKKLDTRLIVALRAIHLASVKIQTLTNDELFPQLGELLGGLMSMWKVMWECHNAQAAIASEMQSLENSLAGNEASEAHIRATKQLEQELEKWQSHFQRWINSQKNYIEALHAWLLKCHLEPERDSRGRAISPHWRGKPAIFRLLSSWKDALLKLEQPQQAVDAIGNFSVLIHSLEVEQAGELDLKRNAEKSARELDYDSRALQRLENRYIEYKEDSNADNETGPSRKLSMQSKKAELDSRRSLVESAKQRHTEVMLDRKETTLKRFRDQLPGVFKSMALFAEEALKTYERLQPDKIPAWENGIEHHFSDD